MKLRIATYNLNNLFDRARLLNEEGFSAKSKPVLLDIQKLGELLEEPSYAGATGTQILALLKKYHLDNRNKKPEFFFINEVRERLFKVSKGVTVLAAAGRGDWVGWIELVREAVDAASTENTARVIQALNADVLCTVEVESRLVLDRFNRLVQGKFPPTYAHNLLVDGNDERGIDVGLLSRFEIRSVRSHIDDAFTAANGQQFTVFSRDCAEYEIALPGGETLWMLCNHFKSQGFGSPASNNAKRQRQADRVRAILKRFDLKKELVVVAGDFNDQPDSAPLKSLLATPDLFDTLTSPLLAGPRWTYQDKTALDYLLVSKALQAKLTAVAIERRGIFSATNFQNHFPHFPEVTSKTDQASDHAAVVAEFDV